MRYADSLMTQGEVIVVRARQHWLALFLDARSAVVLWLIGALLLLSVLVFNVTDRAIRDIISIIGLGAIGFGLLIFLLHFWRWWSQDYLVTNRRILKVEGIFNKHSADSSLEKINDAVLDQNIVGRMLNYGDLDILTAADSAIDRYRMLNRAPAFKREMLQQKYALETEFAYNSPPTPPLRPASERPEPPAVPVAVAPVTAAAPEPPPQEPLAPVSPWPAAPAEPPWQQVPAGQDPLPGDGGAPTPEASVASERVPGPTPVGGASTPPDDDALPAAALGTMPAPAQDDATAITQTLARLADLRDRGAITAEEYEAKKDELLGRL